MFEHEKRVLTAEEIVARRDNDRTIGKEALYREAEAVIRAAYHVAARTNGSRAASVAAHETADAPPRA